MLVIDADSIVYRAGFAAKGEPISHQIQIMKGIITKCEEAYKKTGRVCEEREIFLSSGKNFRHSIYDKYKANRTGEKPEFYDELRDYLVTYQGATVVSGIEADDACSIIGWNYWKEGDTAFICSIDKDLLQIPGKHFNYVKNTDQFITKEQGMWNYLTQCLTGDKSDNIPGIKFTVPIMYVNGNPVKLPTGNIGPVKAQKILTALSGSVNLPGYVAMACALNKQEANLMVSSELLWLIRDVDQYGPVPFSYKDTFQGE